MMQYYTIEDSAKKIPLDQQTWNMKGALFDKQSWD